MSMDQEQLQKFSTDDLFNEFFSRIPEPVREKMMNLLILSQNSREIDPFPSLYNMAVTLLDQASDCWLDCEDDDFRSDGAVSLLS